MGRILITNVYSTLNKGDAAIVMSQAALLRELLPGMEIVVQSWHPETDSARLGCRVVGPFFDLVSRQHPEWSRPRQVLHIGHTFFRTLLAARWVGLTGRTPPFRLRKNIREAFEAYRQADLVVSVGGNYLYSYRGRNSFSFLKHCHQIMLAQAMRKPVVLWAQSLGPVEIPLFRRLVRHLVNRTRRVLVREKLSVHFLKELHARTDHLAVTPDTAFLLTPETPAQAERRLMDLDMPPGGPRIGLTVRDWDFPNEDDPGACAEAYREAVARTVDWMADVWGARMVFLPQCITPDTDDRFFTRCVCERVTRKEHVVIAEDDLPPGALKAIAGRLDLFIGTRMHSNIFALAMGTPTLAISYQPKTDGIMRMLGMGRWVLPIANLHPDGLRTRLEELWAERAQVRCHLLERIPEICKQARHDIALALKEIMPLFCDGNAQPGGE
jgi:colanic acid/amylovoran biosynthesis protein